jgi:hypothetical protein
MNEIFLTNAEITIKRIKEVSIIPLFFLIAIALFFPQVSFGANPPSTTGLDLSPYVTSMDYTGSGIYRANFATSFFGSTACLNAFSSVSGSYFSSYFRPSSTYIADYSGSATGGAINATWMCTNGNVFYDTPSGGKPLFATSTAFTGSENGTFLFNINAGTASSSATLAYFQMDYNGSTPSVTPITPSITLTQPATSTPITDVIGNMWGGVYDGTEDTATTTYDYTVQINYGMYQNALQWVDGGNTHYSGGSDLSWTEYKERSLPIGTYYARASLYETAWTPDIDGVLYSEVLVATSTLISFQVATSSVFTLTASSTPLLPNQPAPIECSTFDIGCYIGQALQWAFYPDPGVIQKFNNTQFFEDKAPFVYGTQIPILYSNFQNATPVASSSISITWEVWNDNVITIWNPSMWTSLSYWPMLFDIMVAITYLMFATAVWFRVRNLHSNHTQ